MITLTTSHGKSYEIKEFVKNGDQIKIIFENEQKEQLIYYIKITRSGRLVMN